MRKTRALIAAAVIACLAVPAYAARPKVTTTKKRVTFTMENPTPYAMTCKGTLTAKTKSGKFIDAKLDETMSAGGELELYIIADDGKDPFVDGWSDISCTAVPPPPPEDPDE